MNRILRFYVIREVALSTLLTLFTIVFMMLMNMVSRYMIFILQPSVKLSQVLLTLAELIPEIMLLAIPMAILIGVLIGVGRMTLDREMLACKASGINLFSIFLPMILLGGLVSLALMGLSSKVIPRMLADGFKSIGEMQFALVTSLEPGRFYGSSDMKASAIGGGDFEFFFRERDPKNPDMMKGITLKLEEDNDAVKREADARAKEAEELKKSARTGKTPPAAALDDILSTATQLKAAAAVETGKKVSANIKKDKSGDKDEPTSSSVRRNQLTLITAESGLINFKSADDATTASDVQKREMVLTLKNGTIHQLNPDPENRQYMVIRFSGLQKTLFTNTEIDKREKTMTNAELWKFALNKKAKRENRRAARRELTQRFSITLASFVFVLIGIPLAIWVRPSGKSWGILMAVGLMLVYYLLMQWGLGLVKYGKPMGYFVAFSPNVLFVALGAVLWRRAIKS